MVPCVNMRCVCVCVRNADAERGADEKRWREVIPFELLAVSCANCKSSVIQQLHTRHKHHLREAEEKLK